MKKTTAFVGWVGEGRRVAIFRQRWEDGTRDYLVRRYRGADQEDVAAPTLAEARKKGADMAVDPAVPNA